MKSRFLLLSILLFPATCFGDALFFTPDDLIDALNVSEIPTEQYPIVAAEYEAQMDKKNGTIDRPGLQNVCFAAGLNPATPQGAQQCTNFVNAAITQKNCRKKTKCNYGELPSEISPTPEYEARKCIFNETMKFVLDWEKGLNTSPGLAGNEGGNVTKYGITSKFSNLSVTCVKCMTWEEAQSWYWTHMYKKFNLNKMPIEISAPLMQFSVQHNGYVLYEVKKIIFNDPAVKNSPNVQSACTKEQLQETKYSNTYFNECEQIAAQEYVKAHKGKYTLEDIQKYMQNHSFLETTTFIKTVFNNQKNIDILVNSLLTGGKHLFDAFVDNEIKYWSGSPKYKSRAQEVRNILWPATENCIKRAYKAYLQ